MTQIKNSCFSLAIAFATAIFMVVGAFHAFAEAYVIRDDGRRVDGHRIQEDSDGTIRLHTAYGVVTFEKGTYKYSSLSKPDFVPPKVERSAPSRPTPSVLKGDTVSGKGNVVKRLCWFDPAAEAVWEEIIQSSSRLSLVPRMKGVDATQAEKQLEAFGTRSMPKAYAQYQEACAKVQEVKRARLENFPQGPASDPTDGTMFAKVNKNLATAVARVFRRRDELCFFLMFHQMGIFSEEMLAKYDSRPIHLRLAPESADWPDDTPTADTALAAEDASFAAQHLPGTYAGYQRLCGLFEAGAKQYGDLRRTALDLDATRARGELTVLKGRLESIQEVLQQYKKDFSVKRLEFGMGEATAESLATLDQSNAAKTQKFERGMGVKVYVAQYATKYVVPLPGGATIEMAWCPPGTFMMGSPENEEGREKDETQHKVTLTKGFWMAKTEVTQKQWMSVMENNPSSHKGDDLPVENVTWNDCVKFCEKTGLQLPTEAQWEYACRAGSKGPFAGSGRPDEMGWYYLNGSRAHAVGQKQPNAWGLYDMHGNVMEWCADWYRDYPKGAVTDPKGTSPGRWRGRVLRGGSWHYDEEVCRSAHRASCDPSSTDDHYGFRPISNMPE